VTPGRRRGSRGRGPCRPAAPGLAPRSARQRRPPPAAASRPARLPWQRPTPPGRADGAGRSWRWPPRPEVDRAGWYRLGPRPGERGPAVIVGHVDSREGPAVFFRLGQLRRGDRIVVGQDGGAAAAFAVERVERHPKEALPVARIWNLTGQPVLRLITCGGSFDRSTGHYRDNVIVYARAAA
jgi:Sortase domain